MRSFLRFHLPVLTWALLTGSLLLAPGSPDSSWPPWLERLMTSGGDKLVHFLLFFVLAWMSVRSLKRLPVGSPVGTSILVTSLYAGLLEWGQQLVPLRSVEWWDGVVGVAGALTGGLLLRARKSGES